MNAQSRLYRSPIYCSRWLSVFALAAAILGSAPGADAQRLTPTPFAFPPSFQVSPPAQVPSSPVGRSQGRAVIKTISRKPLTKAQLNQALIAEAYRRNSDHVAGLLAQGADPNARDSRGNTVLAEAVQLGNGPVVALLLQRKADPNVRNGAGFTPLGIATAESGLATMHLLLAHGANPNAPQRGGVTPLVMAVSLGNPEIVRLLAEARAVVNPSTSTHPGASSGRISAPSVAVESRSLYREAVLLELLDHGADDNGRDAQNNPPLVASTSRGDFADARLLII